ncbi:hypothetical protein Bca52824_014522 [Brassica carinata]|uniref:Secreted protein n=1 Tax=Brassica carinata TaxID=52824 RepID=A0A8X8B2E5_BRACI|nr:hypothetical protein Bca52824_014522 [Brassica carinata]
MFVHGSFLLLPLLLSAVFLFATEQFEEPLSSRSDESLVDLWAWSGVSWWCFTCVRSPSPSLIKVKFQPLWFSCDVVGVVLPQFERVEPGFFLLDFGVVLSNL